VHLRIRFIGKALDHVVASGGEDRPYPLHIHPELMHVGDLVRHPLFPGRAVYVVAREIDLIECCVTVWIDELPEYGRRSSDRVAAEAGVVSESA
jgi:hypothetical protein